MTTLNIAGALFAICIMTSVLHFVAELNEGPGNSRFNDAAATALALVSVAVYVGLVGWLGHYVTPAFSDEVWGLSVTAGLCIVTIAATLYTLRRRRRKGSEAALPQISDAPT